MTPQQKARPTGAFLTTQWTRVLQARGNTDDARAALSELCETYYQPVFTFIRYSIRDDEKARDLTQEFFARLLKGDRLNNLQQARGRFRSYLLGAVKHFISDTRDRDSAAKRNPDQPLESIHSDTTFTTHERQYPDLAQIPPDVEFDRKWAVALLDRALANLAADKDITHFEALKPWLTGDVENLSQAETAAKLGTTEAAVKVAIHRLRRRFRDSLKEQIAATLPEPDPALVSDEMSYLVSILR